METLELARQLVSCGSVTSGSNLQCTEILMQVLGGLGFEVLQHRYRDVQGVEKVCLSACRHGTGNVDQGIAFLTHNDVVSVDGWRAACGCGPLDAVVDSGRLWGRGACDMKGPIASAISAIAQIEPRRQIAPIYFFVTGDEECGMLGARMLVLECPIYRRMVQANSMGIITEPTQLSVVNAHKGGCQFTVVAHGIAAHSSTSEGLNANWQLIPYLNYLQGIRKRVDSAVELRNGAFNPDTMSLNIVVKNQPAAYNITVGQASCSVFLRTMPETAWSALVDELVQSARDLELEVSSIAALPPVHTPPENELVATALRITGHSHPRAVSYATDGCRYHDLKNMIVLGPGSIEQAHRCDEWIALEQLQMGTHTYHQLLEHYTVHPHPQTHA